MKKLLVAGLLSMSILGMSGCNYDDSEDIDLLIPKDDTQETEGALNLGPANNPLEN